VTERKCWHVLVGQSSVGPLSEHDLLRSYFEGRYSSDAMVWRSDSGGTWQRLGDAFPLAELTPPALPGTASVTPNFVASTITQNHGAMSWVSEPSYAWRRFFAKQLDLLGSAGFMFLLIGIMLSANPGAYETLVLSQNFIVLNMMSVCLAIIPNAIVLGLSGRSLGKLIFGLKVVDRDGHPPSFVKAFRREFQVTLLGLAVALPVISLLAGISSYNHLKRHGSAPWDFDADLTMLYRKPSVGHYALLVFGALVFVVVTWVFTVAGTTSSIAVDANA
jgi:uncharacterized RDD family membrane protein YckC